MTGLLSIFGLVMVYSASSVVAASQISQSLTAVGSGGFAGLGLGASKQKLFFLPEASSDFIFAIIGEELGLIGTCLVAVAFLVFFYRGMRIILRAPDRFGFYLGLGITLMVVLQGFINISMVQVYGRSMPEHVLLRHTSITF